MSKQVINQINSDTHTQEVLIFMMMGLIGYIPTVDQVITEMRCLHEDTVTLLLRIVESTR